MKKKSLFEAEQGFTLVEILISIALLALLALGLMSSLKQSISSSSASSYYTTAMNIARDRIETHKSQEGTNQLQGSGYKETVTKNGVDYQLVVTNISDEKDVKNIPSHFLAVNITVSWPQIGATPSGRVSYSTCLER